MLEQAFELCVVRNWNLSHEKLRSYEMQERLRELRVKNDPLWIELNRVNDRQMRPSTGAIVLEDVVMDADDEGMDDSVVNLKDVLAETHRKAPSARRQKRVSTSKNGGLQSSVDAENIDEVPLATVMEAKVAGDAATAGDSGRGKRKRVANRLYSLADFTQHWDGNGSDIE
jgi:hypothetical protein